MSKPKDVITLDDEEYVRLASLSKFLKGATGYFGESNRQPLEFTIEIGDDVVATVNIGRIVRRQLGCDLDDGYAGWRGCKATRDALVSLIAFMDRWDRDSHKKSAARRAVGRLK